MKALIPILMIVVPLAISAQNDVPSPFDRSWSLFEIEYANAKTADAQRAARRQLETFARSWDGKKAVTWCESIDDWSVRNAAMVDVARLWARREVDAADAMTWVRAFENELSKAEAIRSVACELAKKKQTKQAMSLVDEISDKYLSTNMPDVAAACAAVDLNSTIEWVKAEKDADAREWSLQEMAKAVARKDVAAALELSTLISDEKQRFKTVRPIISDWAKEDRDSALGYTRAMKNDLHRAFLLMDIVEIWAATDIQSAKALADSIEDGVRRSIALRYVVREQAKTDARAAAKLAAVIENAQYRDFAFYDVIKASSNADAAFAKSLLPAIKSDALRQSAGKIIDTVPR